MNEMLANYHFLTRDYANAVVELERVLAADPADRKAKKKLIICLTQTDRLAEALVLFRALITEDIASIIDTDVAWEDCPCPGLTTRLEQGGIPREDECRLFIELGILWLYCDKKKSLQYFRRAEACDPEQTMLSPIIHLIESHTITTGAPHVE